MKKFPTVVPLFQVSDSFDHTSMSLDQITKLSLASRIFNEDHIDAKILINTYVGYFG